MNEIQTELLEHLKCPCDSVVKLDEKVRGSELIMARIETQLETLCTELAEVKADIKDLKTNSPSADRFNRLEQRVDELEKKPALRWNGIVDKVIGAIVGGLVGYMLFKMGIS